MKLRPVAVVLLLTVPSPCFAQVQADARQLDRIRLQLSEASVLERWNPGAEPPLAVQVVSCADARAQGKRDSAEQHKAGGWWLSAPVGFFVPLIGIGIATGIAATTHAGPKSIPAGVDAACYRDAYGDRARTRNMLTALAASSIGTMALIALIAASGGFFVMPGGPA